MTMNNTKVISPLLLNAQNITLSYKDLNLVYQEVSQTVAKMVGFNHYEEMIGVDDYGLKCDIVENADLFRRDDREVLISRKPTQSIVIQHYVTGTKILLIERKPIIDQQDQLLGLFTYGTEITDAMRNCFTKSLFKLDLELMKRNRGVSYKVQSNEPTYNLTKRELECLYYMIRGKSAKDVGDKLCLSKRTIEDYNNNLKNKMGCLTRSQVIDKAFAEGLIYLIPESLFS